MSEEYKLLLAKLEAMEKRMNEAPKKEEEKKELPKVNVKPLPSNPDPKLQQTSKVPVSFQELTDPRQPDVSRLNKIDKTSPSARIIKLYDAETPNGRIF